MVGAAFAASAALAGAAPTGLAGAATEAPSAAAAALVGAAFAAAAALAGAAFAAAVVATYRARCRIELGGFAGERQPLQDAWLGLMCSNDLQAGQWPEPTLHIEWSSLSSASGLMRWRAEVGSRNTMSGVPSERITRRAEVQIALCADRRFLEAYGGGLGGQNPWKFMSAHSASRALTAGGRGAAEPNAAPGRGPRGRGGALVVDAEAMGRDGRGTSGRSVGASGAEGLVDAAEAGFTIDAVSSAMASV